MKDFLKTVLAVIIGIFVTTFILFALLGSVAGALASVGKGTAVLPKSGVLTIDLSKVMLAEQSAESDPFSSIPGKEVSTIGIWDAVRAIDIAAEDPGVKYIYIKSDGSVSDLAALWELRQALSAFRGSGKAIVSYMEAPTTGSYYISSVSDKVYMTAHSGATTMVVGVGTQLFFLKDLLDKLGVNVQLVRHGKYKSAGEMFSRSSISPENTEQNQHMVDMMWATLRSEIALSRDLTEAQVDDAIDNLRLCTPADFLECGFVDELLTREGLQDKLAALAVADAYKDVKFIAFPDYVSAKILPSKAKNQIAVVYVDGQMMDGSGKQQVDGDRFASVLQKVRADSTVKAVVLRVNSPGGAVLSAEKIRNEVDLTRAQKPVIASYGDYAASGGYWVSSSADHIFTTPVTLTGSIGVFGTVPEFSKTLKNVAHVSVTSITSNKHGDLYGFTRPFDAAEYAYMERSIEDIYTKFTALVSEGRGLSVEEVDNLGQGRVWTGTDAVANHLADETGSLKDAILYAAQAAGEPDLAQWDVKGYPKPASALDDLMEMLGGKTEEDEVSALLGGLDLSKPQILARLPYEISFR